MLHPISAVISGDDETQRKTIEHGKILAVHRIGEHDLAVARMIDIQRLDEVRSLVGHGTVHAGERDLARARLHTCRIENGPERYSSPPRIAHGAVSQLSARNPRIEESAAVARALVD